MQDLLVEHACGRRLKPRWGALLALLTVTPVACVGQTDGVQFLSVTSKADVVDSGLDASASSPPSPAPTSSGQEAGVEPEPSAPVPTGTPMLPDASVVVPDSGPSVPPPAVLDTYDGLVSHIDECGLLAERGTEQMIESSYNRCRLRCLNETNCDSLERFACTGERDRELERCLSSCTGAGAFHCESDGSLIDLELACDGTPHCSRGEDEEDCLVCLGKTVPLDRICDGRFDCEDGNDEVGCPIIACDDGSLVSVRARCDGKQDCPDGEDEFFCPDLPLCKASGEPMISRCDLKSDCSDGSDEMGCLGRGRELFVCNDREPIAAEFVCDLEYDCADRSDERGCVQIACERP